MASVECSPAMVPPEAFRLLQSVARSLWTDALDFQDLQIRRLQGAMTNQVYECFWAAAPSAPPPSSRRVLVRIYGDATDLFFNRSDEIRTFEAISKLGLGPRLLGRFPNGRIEEFLHARTLSAADLRNPEVSARIAVTLRRFHQLSIPGTQEPQIWQRLRDWLQKALTLCSPEHVDEFHLRNLGDEIEELRMRLSRPEEELGFCHNDLQYGNIMLNEKDNSVTLIDYEYSSYNPVAYDLANYFCEMAADYHTDTPHLLDYSRYPGFQERCRFIELYLGSSCKLVSQTRIEDLSKDTDNYALASHIHWGLWGIISACVNEIEFDYIEYAKQRFKQFFLSKLMMKRR